MNVSQILRTKGDRIIYLEVGCTVFDVAKILDEQRIGAVPIMDDGKLVGIISERDLVRGLASQGGAVLDKEVSALMTSNVVTCEPCTTIHELMATMTRRRIRHVPVVEDGKLTGMVTIGDVVNERLHETELEAEHLKEYIAHG